MMNDYAWTTLHAHRESEHRNRALHRGGDEALVGGTPSGSARRLRLWATRHLAADRRSRATVGNLPAVRTTTATAAVPTLTAARRRTASDAPTAAALAWARLASGEGSLAPATSSATERGRDAA